MAVVNSELEADVLRYLYFVYGPVKIQRDGWHEIIAEGRGKKIKSESWDERAHEITHEIIDEPSNELIEPPPPKTAPKPEPINASVHIGFHDIFIEGEYLTVCSK